MLLLEVASESASASSSSVSGPGGSPSATCAPAGDGDRGDGDEEWKPRRSLLAGTVVAAGLRNDVPAALRARSMASRIQARDPSPGCSCRCGVRRDCGWAIGARHTGNTYNALKLSCAVSDCCRGHVCRMPIGNITPSCWPTTCRNKLEPTTLTPPPVFD
jgi:hypothetical protein